MSRTTAPLLVLTAILTLPSLAPAAAAPAPLTAPAATQSAASLRAAVREACKTAVRPGQPSVCELAAIDRRELPGGVAEYSLKVRVGLGPHDVIGLHRVVQESAPNRPLRTAKAVLLAHGDAWGFDAAFLSAATATPPSDHAFPIFLAQHGIDVWGIDFRWTQVPAGTTDLTFMRNWGTAKDRDDLAIALAAARAGRLLTGSGGGKIDLLGWSRGALTGYAYMSAESQLPRALRNVRGFVPVDILMKTDDDGVRQAACNRYAAEQAMLDAGTFASTTGQLFAALGTGAESAPAAPSPIVPGFTNEQAALFAGSATYLLLPPDQVFVPFYHFNGGTFGAGGVPTGLLYTQPAALFHFEAGASAPFEPVRLLADGDAGICGSPNVPFDDHLGQIEAPVFYVGAGGGFGAFGLFTTTLLGSHDVPTHVVSLVTADQRAIDIGHADIWLADDAQALFWQPILDWIAGH